MMRRISLGLFLAGCMALTAQAQHVPAYLNVELKSPEDQRFMEQVQFRADRWVEENDSWALDMDAFGPISSSKRVALDSLPLEASGTWRINLRHTDAYDTLALVGFTMNYHQTITWPEFGMGSTREIDAPRYVLPLYRYEEFLSPTELARMTAIAENAVQSIAVAHYVIGNYTIASIPWEWNTIDNWQLFTQDMAFTLIERWYRDEGRSVYSTPNFLSAIPIREMETLVYHYDTTYTVWEGDTSLAHVSWRKRVSGLEFLFQPEPLEQAPEGYDFGNYRTYSITCNWIGLTFGGEEHSSIWMPKEDFVKASRIPQLGGWLDAIFANEVAKHLQTR